MKLDPRRATTMAMYRGRANYFCSVGCKDKFLARPELFLDKAPGMRLTVGVMGSAGGEQPTGATDKAYALGKAMAEKGFVVITGTCPGLPYACARGVRDHDGLSVGISPALSLDEHVHKYLSPSDVYDVIVYTGSGLMGREVTNIHSSDMVIIVGGRSGTLGEFAIAYDEGKLIGVLEGTGGITKQIATILAGFSKDTGARLIYDADPAHLIQALSDAYSSHHYRRPSCFCDEFTAADG
jgi:uncharacterized protein (TIGR00725 family)